MTSRLVRLPNGLDIHYREDGRGKDAPVLVLLNGSILNLSQWDRFLKRGPWLKRFRVVRFDYCDTGGSSRRERPVSLGALVNELGDFLDALVIERAHFYGVSQGTIVLQGLAGAAPGRIRSASGYGWYHGDFSGIRSTEARIAQRVKEFRRFEEIWEEPLDRASFERLWSNVYRTALFERTWEEMSVLARAKDWLVRRTLFPLLAPTSIRSMHDWFDYCVRELTQCQPLLREGHRALSSIPVFLQHATADQTLEIGMARELCHEIAGATLREYGDGYDHASPAFRSAQARAVTSDHSEFLRLAAA